MQSGARRKRIAKVLRAYEGNHPRKEVKKESKNPQNAKLLVQTLENTRRTMWENVS